MIYRLFIVIANNRFSQQKIAAARRPPDEIPLARERYTCRRGGEILIEGDDGGMRAVLTAPGPFGPQGGEDGDQHRGNDNRGGHQGGG